MGGQQHPYCVWHHHQDHDCPPGSACHPQLKAALKATVQPHTAIKGASAPPSGVHRVLGDSAAEVPGFRLEVSGILKFAIFVFSHRIVSDFKIVNCQSLKCCYGTM